MAGGVTIADAAPLAIHEGRFECGVLQRDFWHYVWDVRPADRAPFAEGLAESARRGSTMSGT